MNIFNGQQVLVTCPSIDELTEFSIGRLPGPALNRVAAHIEACTRCVAALAQLEDSADPLLADLREPLPFSIAEADEVSQRVLEHVPAPIGPGAENVEISVPVGPANDEVPPDLPGYVTLTPWIGKGGMGVVWRVRDLQFERPLAVKVMMAAWTANAHLVRRFFEEARITAQLAHPSIVPVQAMGRLADRPALLHDEAYRGPQAGETTRSRVGRGFAANVPATAFRPCLPGVGFRPHEGHNPPGPEAGQRHGGRAWRGSGHRLGGGQGISSCSDSLGAGVAPTNGTPNESEDRTTPGSVMGTWEYMPPEQANGRIKEMNKRLRRVWPGRDVVRDPHRRAALCRAHEGGREASRRAKPTWWTQARLEKCGADAELVGLARACLSPEPNDRPEDASVVEKQLTDYMASVDTRLREAERDRAAAEAQEDKARRRLRWVAANALLILVVLLLAAFYARRYYAALEEQLAETIDRAWKAALGGDLEGTNRRLRRRSRPAPPPDKWICCTARSPCTAARARKRGGIWRRPFNCCRKASRHGAHSQPPMLMMGTGSGMTK